VSVLLELLCFSALFLARSLEGAFARERRRRERPRYGAVEKAAAVVADYRARERGGSCVCV
jgi:hypothetical protein